MAHSKALLIGALFVLQNVAFVVQTETTAFLNEYHWKEPILLLTITHGSWWCVWIGQALYVGTKAWWRSRRGYTLLTDDRLPTPFRTAIWDLHVQMLQMARLVVPDSGEHVMPSSVSAYLRDPAFLGLAKIGAAIVMVLNAAGGTWYVAMTLLHAADVLAIYNCSTFTTYLFSIPMLKEAFEWRKLASVVIAVGGVVIVSYSLPDSDRGAYPYRLWGDLIISIGAVAYGLYECLYAKYMGLPQHCQIPLLSESLDVESITTRDSHDLPGRPSQFQVRPPGKPVTPVQRATFSNFCTCLLSIATVAILGPAMLVGHFTVHPIAAPPLVGAWGLILSLIVANMTFVVSFLALLSLTLPTVASVTALSLIWIVGIVEWLLGAATSTGQWIGFLVIMVGFVGMCWGEWDMIDLEE